MLLLFLVVSALSFISLNKLGFFLSDGPHMRNYKGPKNFISIHATNFQKIGATIQLAIASIVLGIIGVVIAWVVT